MKTIDKKEAVEIASRYAEASARASAKASEEAAKAAARAVDKMSKAGLFRINLTMPIELDKVLEDLGTSARASGGFKIAKTQIVRALIMLLQVLRVDVSGVKTEEEMLGRLIEAVRRYK